MPISLTTRTLPNGGRTYAVVTITGDLPPTNQQVNDLCKNVGKPVLAVWEARETSYFSGAFSDISDVVFCGNNYKEYRYSYTTYNISYGYAGTLNNQRPKSSDTDLVMGYLFDQEAMKKLADDKGDTVEKWFIQNNFGAL